VPAAPAAEGPLDAGPDVDPALVSAGAEPAAAGRADPVSDAVASGSVASSDPGVEGRGGESALSTAVAP
jgi:hypothetical protein